MQQGAGNVGTWLVAFLLEKQVSRIVVGDVNENHITSLVKKFPMQVQSGQITASVLPPGDYSILYEGMVSKILNTFLLANIFHEAIDFQIPRR